MSNQIHTYPELQQQIHDDLRIQHPEWVKSKWRMSHVRFLLSRASRKCSAL